MTKKKAVVLAMALCAASFAKADEYQELTPVAAYSGMDTTYIVFAANVGAHGCSLNRNSIAITAAEHSPELVRSSLSIALAAISTETSMKVFWSGCMNGGRPKATLIGYGTTELN